MIYIYQGYGTNAYMIYFVTQFYIFGRGGYSANQRTEEKLAEC